MSPADREILHEAFRENIRYLNSLCPGWAYVAATWGLMRDRFLHVQPNGSLDWAPEYGGPTPKPSGNPS